MHVRNIHEREFRASTREVGALIDSLASSKDLLWPTRTWPPMKFDQPLGVGARGGHGPIRYDVEAYQPGESIRFRFTGPKGFHGYHGYDVVSATESPVVLRQTLEMKARGLALLSWPLIFRPLHDALIEDSLAKAQASLGEAPEIRPWSRWVRILRWVLTGGKGRAQFGVEAR